MLIVNMSVWESIDTLADFAYRSAHREVMAGRRQWFERMSEAYLVLWWVAAGAIPTVADAEARLRLLREVGPSPDAFTMKSPFPPPSQEESLAAAWGR
jgi:hypothetical protein